MELLVIKVEQEEASPLAEEASWLGSPGPDRSASASALSATQRLLDPGRR